MTANDARAARARWEPPASNTALRDAAGPADLALDVANEKAKFGSGGRDRLSTAEPDAAAPGGDGRTFRSTTPTAESTDALLRPGLAGAGPAEPSARGDDASAKLTNQQTRFVNGRTFVQNGTQWVDTLAQSRPADEKPVQVVFNSDAYFDLLAAHPDAAPWLALGTSVQVVIDGTLYEVIEEDEEA